MESLPVLTRPKSGYFLFSASRFWVTLVGRLRQKRLITKAMFNHVQQCSVFRCKQHHSGVHTACVLYNPFGIGDNRCRSTQVREADHRKTQTYRVVVREQLRRYTCFRNAFIPTESALK